jgi:hypothetical protein
MPSSGDAELRAGQALQTMTKDEGLSLREAAEWCSRRYATANRIALGLRDIEALTDCQCELNELIS